jgi:hypothetical protein
VFFGRRRLPCRCRAGVTADGPLTFCDNGSTPLLHEIIPSKWLLAAAAITLWVSPVIAKPMPVDNIHALTSGVYELAEWHIDGVVLKPPQVEGRFILLNGTITTILHNRTSSGTQTTMVLVGKYVLDKAHFSYGYEDASIFTETPSGTSSSHKQPWEGERSFTAIATPDGIRFQSENGQQEFLFTAPGLRYSENGQTLRVWRRIAAE